MRQWIGFILAFVAVCLWVPNVAADTFGTIELTQINEGSGTGPFARVDMNFAGGVITVTVTGLTGTFGGDPAQWYVFNRFGFNTTNAGLIDPPLSVTANTFTSQAVPFTLNAGANSGFNGFGKYEFLLNGPSGGGAAIPSFSFSITRPAAPFTGVENLYELSSNGEAYFSVHVAPYANGQLIGATYIAATGTIPPDPGPTPVPEPTSLLLLGSGMAALGLAAFRKKNQ